MPGPLRLEGVDAEHRLTIPLSPRLDVRAARLHLAVRNSTALLDRLSSLAVILNGRTVAQLPLQSASPSFAVDVELPLDLLKTGYNDLRLRAVQHYTETCERPNSPELWSEVDLLRSHVAFDAGLKAVAAGAGELDRVFDARLWQPLPLAIVTAGLPQDDAMLEIGAIAAQGAGLRYRHHPLAIDHVPASAPPEPGSGNFPGLDAAALAAGDAILVGTRGELEPFLAASLVAQIGDSYLAALPNDADPTRAIVIVSGRDAAGVRRAAEALALARGVPYPGGAGLRAAKVAPPALAPYSRGNGVYPDRTYAFRDLGFGDRVTTEAPLDLEFNIPPDLFGREDANVELHLRFSYSAGLRDDSALEVLLNGLLVRPIRLTSADGGSFDDYVVALPLKSLQPGPNVISFVPDFRGLHEGECQHPVNARLVLYADSTIVMPAAGHYTRLPDLQRLARTVFPLAVQPDGAGLAVRVLGDGSEPVSAAWTLLAKLAQVNGYPLLATQVTRGEASGGRHELIVGAVSALPTAAIAGAPIALDEPSVARYPTGVRPADAATKEPAELRGGTTTGVDLFPAETARTAITVPRELGDWGLMMQYRRPGSPSTVVVTASDPALLRERVARLVTFEVWSGLQGDTAFWRDTADSVVAQELGNAWHVGDIGPAQRVEYWFSHYPWWWLLATVLTLLLVALLVRAAIVRRRAKRHADVGEPKEY